MSTRDGGIKRISSWGAILFAPTLVGTIYGMNSVHMPELEWSWGYPFALLLMALVSGGLHFAFKRRGWIQAPPAKAVAPRWPSLRACYGGPGTD